MWQWGPLRCAVVRALEMYRTHLEHDEQERNQAQGHNLEFKLFPSMDEAFVLSLANYVRHMFINQLPCSVDYQDEDKEKNETIDRCVKVTAFNVILGRHVCCQRNLLRARVGQNAPQNILHQRSGGVLGGLNKPEHTP